MSTSRTQTAKARVQVTTTKTQTAKASLATKTQKTQTARARITAKATHTQTAKARITATATQTITAKARIQGTTSKTQLAKARITATTSKTQLAKASIKVVTQQTQTARALIAPVNLRVLAPAQPVLTVSYGTFALNELNGIIITTPYGSDDTDVFGDFMVQFRCRMRPEAMTGNEARDDFVFGAMITNLETQLRIPRQRLIARFGVTILRDWNFTLASQTAFLITPELTLIKKRRRDFTYSFRVRCQFPGNVPSNAFRRDSTTSIGDSLRERRTCTMTATWTSSPGINAYDQYNNNGDAFFNAYLPPNGSDQYNGAGRWVRADENPVSFNDEKSLCTATRVYWECFAGRRESSPKTISTIGDRRVFVCPSTWVATSATALQNYLDGGDAYYSKVLPGPFESNAEWVLVDEEPQYNDRNGVLTVVRVYHEVVKGLRDYTVDILTLPAQIRQVSVSGSYYKTSISAYLNFSNNVGDLISGVLRGLNPPMTRYESLSVPKRERYDTTTKRYFFTHTFTEFAYPQGPTPDDPDIVLSTLELQTDVPRDPQSIPDSIPLTRLQTVIARFTAVVDYTKNQDPAKLWASKFRAYVLRAIATKLGGTDPTVDVVDERVGVGLHANTLTGTISLVVTGGSVISLKISQRLVLVPGRDFVPRGDGTSLAAFPYRDTAEKLLIRTAICDYVVGAIAPPPLFDGSNVSGFTGMIDTGKTGEQSWEEQNADGELALDTGWFIDRRAALPYAEDDFPTTQGTGFQVNRHVQVESWRFLSALEPGTSIP